MNFWVCVSLLLLVAVRYSLMKMQSSAPMSIHSMLKNNGNVRFCSTCGSVTYKLSLDDVPKSELDDNEEVKPFMN